MPISINAPVVISVFWTAFKTIITDKFLLLQYHDDGVVYTIFAFDSPSISYSTTIWKSTVPDEIISGGYSQATNDSDKSDFETNFAPIANKTIGLQAVFGGSPIVSRPLLIAGSDGANARFLSTDTSGRPAIVGAAAAGAAVTGNPVLIAGQDGTNTQSILTDTLGRTVTVSAAAVAQNGFSNGEIILASTTVTAIRSTTYTEPSVGAQRSMASSNANDTSAGTGARTVKITYYTLSAGTVAGPFTETITLNGTANVNTVATNICYIEKLEVVTVGSGSTNAGIITLFGSTGGGGGTVWTIATGANKTFGAHHYVPSSKICSITTFVGGIKGADTSGFILRAKDPTNANAAELHINDLLRAPSSGNTPVRTYAAPIKITGPSRITAFAVPDSSSSRTYYASFDFYEE
jgi:hypothetical protein